MRERDWNWGFSLFNPPFPILVMELEFSVQITKPWYLSEALKKHKTKLELVFSFQSPFPTLVMELELSIQNTQPWYQNEEKYDSGIGVFSF